MADRYSVVENTYLIHDLMGSAKLSISSMLLYFLSVRLQDWRRNCAFITYVQMVRHQTFNGTPVHAL
jgi:hypothetical protein